MASLDVLPEEWTRTMAVLQDKCEPTPYEAIEALFLHDIGVPLAEIFDDFDKVPIGVASLAQVHVGHHKASGQRVAVKVRSLLVSVVFFWDLFMPQLQHPHLAEFCDVDMEMVDATLGLLSCLFSRLSDPQTLAQVGSSFGFPSSSLLGSE
jgi:aarF domain-containing kinase